MTNEIVRPQLYASSFACPRCGALAAQEWTSLKGQFKGTPVFALADPSYIGYVPNRGLDEVTPLWTASRCFACKKFSIWLDRDLLFPDPHSVPQDAAHSPNVDMPEDAASLFREAVAVLPHSKRAAAALCRASLERLVKHVDSGLSGKARLDDRLVQLESRVSSSTIDILNVLRHVGNTALHGQADGDESATIYMDEDDATIAETFFVAINVLVDELITKPKRNEALYNALPEGVRASYEQKAGRG